MRTGILDDVANSDDPGTLFLLNRPATIGREAPRIERVSEELVRVLGSRI